MIGRGVEDNQGGLAAAVMTLKAFIEAGVQPERPIACFVADEETGSVYGLSYLIKNHRDVFRKDDLIIIPDSGNPLGTEIEVAEKSILWVQVRTIGKQTHGSDAGDRHQRATGGELLHVRMQIRCTRSSAGSATLCSSRPTRRSSPPRRRPTSPTSTPFPARTSCISTAACCRNTGWTTC